MQAPPDFHQRAVRLAGRYDAVRSCHPYWTATPDGFVESFESVEHDYAAWCNDVLAAGDDPLDAFDVLTYARLDALRVFHPAQAALRPA